MNTDQTTIKVYYMQKIKNKCIEISEKLVILKQYEKQLKIQKFINNKNKLILKYLFQMALLLRNEKNYL